jgi:hypothetical protein
LGTVTVLEYRLIGSACVEVEECILRLAIPLRALREIEREESIIHARTPL